MLNILLMISTIIKLDRFKYRTLTAGEIELCRSVFADLIDYEQVKIMNHPFVPWQPKYVLMAPRGYIHVRNTHYREDYSHESLAYQAIFIHEMTHIYQYQHQINVLVKGAILQSAFYLSWGKYNPYHYQLEAHKAFHQYNIEQQGDIAKDIFLNKIDNIILNQGQAH